MSNKPQPNQDLENLYESLYPKTGQPTITFDYYKAQELVLEVLALRKEANTKGEKARVAAATGKEPQVAQGIPVEEKSVGQEKVEKASKPKGGK